MQTVWKYQLINDISKSAFPYLEVVQIKMPRGAQPLSVGFINEKAWVWALIPDTDAPPAEVSFIILGTGKAAPELGPKDRFLGTYTNPSGSLVNHVFVMANE